MGPLQQMKLVSNNIGYGPKPAPYDEVEQCITLSSDGQVDVVAFRFGEGEPYTKLSGRHRNLDPHEAQTILTLVAAFFEGNPRAFDVTDVGMWELTLIDVGGSEKTYRGPLCGGYEINRQDLSETLRKILDIPELIAFDDKGKDSIISRITLDYHRVQKQEKEIICGTKEKHGPWETSERLILDRETGSIEIYRKTSDGTEIRHSFHLCNDEVAYLLDEYEDCVETVQHVPGEPADLLCNDKIDFPGFASLNHLDEMFTMKGGGARNSLICVDARKFPFFVGSNHFCVILYLQLVAPGLIVLIRADSTIGAHTKFPPLARRVGILLGRDNLNLMLWAISIGGSNAGFGLLPRLIGTTTLANRNSFHYFHFVHPFLPHDCGRVTRLPPRQRRQRTRILPHTSKKSEYYISELT